MGMCVADLFCHAGEGVHCASQISSLPVARKMWESGLTGPEFGPDGQDLPYNISTREPADGCI
jgi:hypothetical protein